jgi:hypothetical protein
MVCEHLKKNSAPGFRQKTFAILGIPLVPAAHKWLFSTSAAACHVCRQHEKTTLSFQFKEEVLFGML